MSREQPKDPFAPVSMTLDYVSSVAGSQKTRTAIRVAVEDAKRGRPTLFAMPTTRLIDEQYEYARSLARGQVKVTRIDTKSVSKVLPAIFEHIETATGGHITFITHEGLLRAEEWPDQKKDYHLIIDEVFDAVLAGEPIKLRDNPWILSTWLNAVPMPPTMSERTGKLVTDEDVLNWRTKRDQKHKAILSLELMLAKKIEGVVESQVEVAKRALPAAKAELQEILKLQPVSNSYSAQPYYRLIPEFDLTAKNPDWPVEMRAFGTEADDVWKKILAQVSKWANEGCALFTKIEPWDLLNLKKPDEDADKEEKAAYWEERKSYNRGLVTIAGFRRPDFLAGFGNVTVMSALFEDTLMYDVWSRLGVTFRKSSRIKVEVPKTPLGKRRLKLHWLTDEAFSKYRRDKAGGIMEILRLIRKSKVINARQPVCILANQDDEPHRAEIESALFKKLIWLPYKVLGQNRYRDYHQLIFTAALNSYTPDIEFAKDVFGVDDVRQRIARLGMTAYQTMMRLSLRKPESIANVTAVVMDKDVAEWLADHFDPVSHVSVDEIDSEGKLKRRKRTGGRKPTGKAKTAAQRMAEMRARNRS